jgi:hypothetical protein
MVALTVPKKTAAPGWQARPRALRKRVQADMKNIATAIDIDQIDHKRFPIPGDELGTLDPSSPNTPWTAAKLSPLLTTSISYMSTLPFDPYNKHPKGAARRYHYATRDYSNLPASDETSHSFDIFKRMMYWAIRARYLPQTYAWDGDSDIPEEETCALYNVANGIHSSGDVLHFSKGTVGGRVVSKCRDAEAVIARIKKWVEDQK